ncbi:ComF family protein [Streptomyces sp. NBC_00078]|uniref:ComF family protein n=1 Tax=unclassified Streptomyces TaxID=2593676 RepID=UPI0022516F2A|nr:phosphoribosyltransferase family protein [Streptomyces sp. NBC_00078]MCX5421225.1 phosphoribosyltransferase family protein [Streptomyces sp. NBC_00078]
MRGWWQWQDLTDLVLPAECGGCGRPRTVLCPECRAALSGAAPSRVRPVPEPPGLPVVQAAARYADEVRAVLLAHKERGALALAAPLGTALAGAVRAGLTDRSGTVAVGGDRPVLLVPVPSARGTVRARGHDPARRIALAAASELRRTGTAARVLAVLRQRRAVADQAGLNSRQRLDNLAGALAVAPGGERLLHGGSVVLVDDLMTTGASLREAARAVHTARAAETGLISYGEANTAVYAAAAREGTREQTAGSMDEGIGGRHSVPGKAGAGGPDDVIRAAVVAASPDSFEVNRN